jgi:hypothetical protein
MLQAKLKNAVLLMFVIVVLGWGGGAAWETQAKDHQEMPIGELTKMQPMPDLSGTWQGVGWGTVVLRPTKKGTFAGTYTDTYGADVGRIEVRWSTTARRYEGTWNEGKYRFGRVVLEAGKDGKGFTGVYLADPKCEYDPGVPSRANFRWSRPNSAPAPNDKPPLREEQEKTPQKAEKDLAGLLLLDSRSQQEQEKTPQKQDKEDFTAWGKEVGGLQAGLAFQPGEKRAYSHEDKVQIVVRVRNVGREPITIQYLRKGKALMGTSPVVTDSEGKPVPLDCSMTTLEKLRLEQVELAPGKEIEISELAFVLKPASESGNKAYFTLYGEGKVRLQYDRLVSADIDPIVSKLTTGKLELEIKPNAPPATDKK